MNRSLILLGVLMALCLIPAFAAEFDINSAKYRRGTEFWTVDIPVTGIQGTYSFNYENLPAGWQTSGLSLMVPASVATIQADYPMRVNVRTASATVLSRTLLFKFSGSGLFLGDYPYNYNFNSNVNSVVSSGSAGAAGSSGSTLGSSSAFSSGYVKTSEPLSTQIVSTQTLRSEYDVLPSYSDLDKIIDAADVVLITKTIQSVIQSNLNCLAKIGYLSDFLGKIESYIVIKGYRAEDLQDIIDGANAEILRLELNISEFEDDIDALGIPALKTELTRSLARLEAAYSAFNDANVDVGPLTIRVNNFNTELNTVNAELNQANALLASDNLEIEKLDGFIQELQDKLEQAQIERENFRNRVVETQEFLDQTQDRVQEIQNEISNIQISIANINDGKDSLANQASNLEREVDQIKQRITINEKREAEIISKITDLRIEVSNNELKLDENELDNINEMIDLLENEVLGVREKIDELDLQCFGDVDVQVQVLNTNELLYSFNPTQFESFFNGFYGIDAYSNFISSQPAAATNPQDLFGYSIFSPEWIANYGASFGSDVQLAYNNGVVTDYSFISDFQCSNYQNMVSNTGTIQSINGNNVVVAGPNGGSMDLQLGACSRINGVQQNYPSVGSNISWRGVLDYGSRYLIHTATCY